MWVALLRGVNVGGNKKLPMAQLRSVAKGLGWSNVSTLLASGNLLFAADGPRADLATSLEAALSKSGLSTSVIMRTHEEIAAAVANNPYLPSEAPSWVHTFFLRDASDPSTLLSLGSEEFEHDELEAGVDVVYVRYGRGVADSKLTGAWLERHLGIVTTARNANTVAKILDKSAG